MTGLLAAAGEVSTGEGVTFWILAPVALAGAMGMVLARNAIHSALFLVLTMGCLGVFYFVQSAPFLGAVQIIVYTGAIMILFLFVLMLVGRDSNDSIVETLRGQRVAAILLGIGFASLAAAAVARGLGDVPAAGLTGDVAPERNVTAVAELLFANYLLAFELTSALLIVAAVGAMVLTHVERDPTARRTQRDLAADRLRSRRPQPLPGPGVFATGDSVATPALLPDGSIAPESVSRLVDPRLPAEPELLPGPDATPATPAAPGLAGGPITGSPDGAGAAAAGGDEGPPRVGAAARRTDEPGSER